MNFAISILSLALLLAPSFPTTNDSAWMHPEAFRLRLGMSKTDAAHEMNSLGLAAKPGKVTGQEVFEYSEGKTVTLEFAHDKLMSIRFELVGFLPTVKSAYAEQKASLRSRFGEGRETNGTILIYDNFIPNIFVVLSADQKMSYGKAGLGYLVVRYFVPAVK